MSFGEFGLQVLHVREERCILCLDLIDLALKLGFLHGQVLEVRDSSFQLGRNLSFSAWFRCGELSDQLLDLLRQSFHVCLEDIFELWDFRFGWPYANGLKLALGVFRQRCPCRR